MEVYTINPLHGIGNSIKFGMPVNQVRECIGGNFESFIRGRVIEELGERFPSDHYRDKGIFCYFDKNGNLEAVEFSREANVVIADTELFALTARKAISLLAQLDPEVLIESDGATSYRLSLGLWSPDFSEGDNAPVESFLTGRPGYYDILRQ